MCLIYAQHSSIGLGLISNGILAMRRIDYIHFPQDSQCRVQQEGYRQMGFALLRIYVRLYSVSIVTLFTRLQVCPSISGVLLTPFMHT